MKTWRTMRVMTGILGVAILVGPPAERAAAQDLTNYIWIGESGDLFSVADNWDRAAVPVTTNDVVGFITNVPMTVNFTENITNYRAALNSPAGTSWEDRPQYLWNLGGNTYTLVANGRIHEPTFNPLTIGEGSPASLTTTNGTLTTAAAIIIGRLTGGAGHFTVSGPGTVLNCGNIITINANVTMSTNLRMTVENGAEVNTSQIHVANDSVNTVGELIIRGVGSKFTATPLNAYLGRRGEATIIVEDGGHFEVASAFTLGGNGSTWVGHATLIIDGGTVHHTYTANSSLMAQSTLRPILHAGATDPLMTVTRAGCSIFEGCVLDLGLDADFSARTGDVFTLIKTAEGVTGTFLDLPEGAVLPLTSPLGRRYEFHISYAGGEDGNDVTLTTVYIPPRGTIFWMR